MYKIYSLSKINITERVYLSWVSVVNVLSLDLKEIYPDLHPDEIPNEQFRIDLLGNGQIFIKIRKKIVKMKVPKDEWQFK